MAEAERVPVHTYDYQEEYSYDQYRQRYLERYGQEEESPDRERVRRTRERPQPNRERQAAAQGLTMQELRLFIAAALAIGMLLVGIILLNALAASTQCSINQLTASNAALQDEIEVINMEIESSTSIEQIETYAMDELNMSYPKSDQFICISEDTVVPEDFAAILREKAYGLQ